MTFSQNLQRWLSMTFVPGSPDKAQQRALAKLWKKLASEKPRWYSPVGDRLAPAVGQALGRLQGALGRVAVVLELQDQTKVPPSTVQNLVDRVFDAFLQRSQLSREQLTFAGVLAEAPPGRGSDYRALHKVMQDRINTLVKSPAAHWQKALPSLEALVFLACFDWEALHPLVVAPKDKALGSDFVEALEDLTYLLEPLALDAVLVDLWTALVGSEHVAFLAELKTARADLLADGRLLDVVRAIRGNPAHPFRWAAYQPPSLSDLVKEAALDFEADLRAHREETEKLQFAKRLHELFGDRKLSDFPGYNDETTGRMLASKLQGLRHVAALKVLYNVRELFHKELFQPFFQGFPLEADFANPSSSQEFRAHLDEYFALMDNVEAFAETFRSPSQSPLAPVLQALAAPFVDTRLKLALRKVVDTVDAQADSLCQQGVQTIKRLNNLFERYVLDLEASAPKAYLGGSMLRSHHPELVRLLQTASATLGMLSGVLRQVVVDLEESGAKLRDQAPRA